MGECGYRRRFKQDYKVHKSGNSDPMSQKKSNPDRVRTSASVALAPRCSFVWPNNPQQRTTTDKHTSLGARDLMPGEGGQERKDVHKKIKSFFAQFKKGSTFDKIRSELQKEKRVADLDSDAAADMRMSTSGASTAAYSSNQKVVGPHLPSLACCSLLVVLVINVVRVSCVCVVCVVSCASVGVAHVACGIKS